MNVTDEKVQNFWNEQAEWSRKTFGTDEERGPIGPLLHLKKEVLEAIANKDDILEYADCLFLIFDATRRAGFTLDTLIAACEYKLQVNKLRVWNKPTSDEPVEHVRSEDDTH